MARGRILNHGIGLHQRHGSEAGVIGHHGAKAVDSRIESDIDEKLAARQKLRPTGTFAHLRLPQAAILHEKLIIVTMQPQVEK